MSVDETTRTWRPQKFGRRSARHIDDPLVEPLWTGIRVLAHVAPNRAEFVDADGGAQPWPDVAPGVVAALQADSAVLDGYLTAEPRNPGVGAFPVAEEAPRISDMGRRLFWPGDNRRRRELDALREAERPQAIDPGDNIVFVAVDLLAVDGELLLDVPLLERKRLLDGVVDETAIVRHGMHVRPPIAAWVATWKSLGFRAIAYKSVNSRYRPGEPNDDWATAPISVR
jgi:hypothetical protein